MSGFSHCFRMAKEAVLRPTPNKFIQLNKNNKHEAQNADTYGREVISAGMAFRPYPTPICGFFGIGQSRIPLAHHWSAKILELTTRVCNRVKILQGSEHMANTECFSLQTLSPRQRTARRALCSAKRATSETEPSETWSETEPSETWCQV